MGEANGLYILCYRRDERRDVLDGLVRPVFAFSISRFCRGEVGFLTDCSEKLSRTLSATAWWFWVNNMAFCLALQLEIFVELESPLGYLLGCYIVHTGIKHSRQGGKVMDNSLPSSQDFSPQPTSFAGSATNPTGVGAGGGHLPAHSINHIRARLYGRNGSLEIIAYTERNIMHQPS